MRHVTSNLNPNVQADVDDFLAEVTGLATAEQKPGPACGFALVVDQLRKAAPQVADAVVAAVDNPRVLGSALADSLTKRGYPIRGYTVNRHRKRGTASGCRCKR